MQRPRLLLTMGDAAGIGPEITLKALQSEDVYRAAVPVVIGDGAALETTNEMMQNPLVLKKIAAPEDATGEPGTVEYIDMGLLQKGGYELGKVQACTGDAAFQYIERAIALCMDGRGEAVVTAPINKEAINLAGHHFAGHTEIFAHYTNTSEYGMLLASPSLKVIHVTTHQSLKDSVASITRQRVLKTIQLAHFVQRLLGLQGKIAVAALNPHASENGLFGNEEHKHIAPAIMKAQSQGIAVEGPIPADTVFVKAMAGQYDLVVAMVHDQGHIPVKLSGFIMDEKTGQFSSVRGINCTIGLPIIRTSVDHGTAFDRAGLNVSREDSMLDAIFMAAKMAENIDLIKRFNRGGANG